MCMCLFPSAGVMSQAWLSQQELDARNSGVALVAAAGSPLGEERGKNPPREREGEVEEEEDIYIRAVAVCVYDAADFPAVFKGTMLSDSNLLD